MAECFAKVRRPGRGSREPAWRRERLGPIQMVPPPFSFAGSFSDDLIWFDKIAWLYFSFAQRSEMLQSLKVVSLGRRDAHRHVPHLASPTEIR